MEEKVPRIITKHEYLTRKKYINSVSGMIAGSISAITMSPIEVIKYRMMVHRESGKKIGVVGIEHFAVKLYKTEGIKSFYKGLGSTLAGLVPNWGIYFMTYEGSKTFFHNRNILKSDVSINIVSSIYAGGVTAIATSPIWVIRTRMMTQLGETGYQTIRHAFEEIYKKEGFRGFYHGLVPTLAGLIHVGIQFPMYEYLKMKRVRNGTVEEPTALDILFASSVSKLTASSVAYPHEVLRSRLQDQGHGARTHGHENLKLHEGYNGVRDVIQITFQEEGWRGFYRGLGPNLIRVVPSAAITLGTFEFCAKYFTNIFGEK
eukprot:gene5776-9597_t